METIELTSDELEVETRYHEPLNKLIDSQKAPKNNPEVAYTLSGTVSLH